jgi:hypothetical protein
MPLKTPPLQEDKGSLAVYCERVTGLVGISTLIDIEISLASPEP